MTEINQASNLTMLPGTKTKSMFECPHCPAKFTVKVSLSNHLRKHSGPKLHCTSDSVEGNFECVHCNGQFSTNRRLLAHVCVNSAEKLLPCPHCPAVFRQAYALKHHLRKHTNGKSFASVSTETFPCEYCPGEFQVKSALHSHVLRCHLRVHYHGCRLCPEKFECSSDATKHLKVQSVKRKSHCSVTFKTKGSQNHLLKVDHTGIEKSFAFKHDHGSVKQINNGLAGQRETANLACSRRPEKFERSSDSMNQPNLHIVEQIDLQNQSIPASDERTDACSEPPTKFTPNPDVEEHLDYLCLNDATPLPNHSIASLNERNLSPEPQMGPNQNHTLIIFEIRSTKRQHLQNHPIAVSDKRNNACPESPEERRHSSDLKNHSDAQSSEQLLLHNHSILKPDDRNASLERSAVNDCNVDAKENLDARVVMETLSQKHLIVGSDRRMDLYKSLSAEWDNKNFANSESSASSSSSVKSRRHIDAHLNEQLHLQDHTNVKNGKKIHACQDCPIERNESVNLRDHSGINSNEQQFLDDHLIVESDKKNYVYPESCAEPECSRDLRDHSDMHSNGQLLSKNHSVMGMDERNYANSEPLAMLNLRRDVRKNSEAHAVKGNSFAETNYPRIRKRN